MDAGLVAALDEAVVSYDFSGVARVERSGEVLYERAAGQADRAHAVANTPTTRFGLASGAKGLTALAVMALAVDGAVSLDTRVRSVLGDALPLIDPRVTVRHLLAHTSGIGDYLPEDESTDIDDYALDVPVHRIESPDGFLPLLDGHPMKRPPGDRFEYCNGGYVVLALVIEAVSGRSYYDVVADRVTTPAGMSGTEFLRTDELPGDVALGYLEVDGRWRTNQLHLPVRGAGDGGVFSNLADVAALWAALFDGRLLPDAVVDEMVRMHSDDPDGPLGYGLGFWLRTDRATAMLEGYDAGTSFRSAYDRSSGLSYTVMANTSAGAWPLVRLLDERLADLAGA